MKVILTQEDIEKGVAIDCHNCPVARAILRATGSDYCFVDGFTATVLFEGEFQTTELPEAAIKLIHCFDTKREEVKPLEFELEFLPK